jgi:beta-hydroxylase
MKILKYNISNNLLFLILFLFLISFFNIYRFINYLLFPNANTHSTSEILKYINYEIIMQYISWFSYLIIFLILLQINLTQTRNFYLKILFTICILFLIYLPILPIVNIINLFLMIILDNPPFLDNIEEEFPLHKNIEKNYENIKKEFINYNGGNIECFRKSNPLLNNIDTLDVDKDFCWRTLYLKKLGKIIVDDKTDFFPETLNIIKDEQIHNAFFSILDPHVEIKPHAGYYKGYLRYHLGIIIPQENEKKPYIICGGKKYEWSEGEGVLFDDMFIHYVNNITSKKRIILYLDIKRKHKNWIIDNIIEFGNYMSENSFIIDRFMKNQHVQDSLKN